MGLFSKDQKEWRTHSWKSRLAFAKDMNKAKKQMNKFRRPQAFKYTKGQKAKRSIDILKHKHYGKVKRWGTLGPFDDDFVWRSY